jgi:hypothetical protein
VRPRSVLNELLRLNLARVEVIDEQEIVVRESSDFLPATTSDESLDMFSGAISDHLWAGVNNISLMNKPELERSIFASNMSQQSIDELSSFAQKEWQRIFPRVVNKARQLYDDDVSNNRGGYRMRIGMYFHGEEDCKNIENPVSDQDSDK